MADNPQTTVYVAFQVCKPQNDLKSQAKRAILASLTGTTNLDF
jgi:hypothetical protein